MASLYIVYHENMNLCFGPPERIGFGDVGTWGRGDKSPQTFER